MKINMLKDVDKNCGGKAFGLSRLINENINCPNGFVIYNSIENIDDLDLVEKLNIFDKNDKLSIRSSASCEDGIIDSFAGIFSTELNVTNDLNSVKEAIKKVNKSLNADTVKCYYKNEKKIIMNIIVQKMINSKLSGICFSEAIDVDGMRCALIEYTDGLGEKLVSGKTKSNRIIVKYSNDNKLSLENCRVEGELFDFSKIGQLIKLINKAIAVFRYPLDIEWAIDDNEVYLLQARPITKKIFIENIKHKKNSFSIVACKGIVTGEVYVIDSNLPYNEVLKEIENFPQGKILITNYTETYYLPAMKKARGIITDNGSYLCHAAIVARELNIPCMVGVEDATKKYKTGMQITLDANNNNIITNCNRNDVDVNYKINFSDLDCFDNYITLLFDNEKVFLEYNLDGITIHKPNNLKSQSIEQLEILVRKNFQITPKYALDDSKYLWIIEVERFKKFPKFAYYYEKIKNVSKKIDYKGIKQIQEELIDCAKEIVINKSDDFIEKLFVNETLAAINELLDGIIPFGYPVYEAYVQSLQLLDNENLKFSDLFDVNVKIKNNKLKEIRKFLLVVSEIKNESYQIVLDLGGPKPDYYEKRDIGVKNYLDKKGVETKNKMDYMYDNYLKDYMNIWQ